MRCYEFYEIVPEEKEVVDKVVELGTFEGVPDDAKKIAVGPAQSFVLNAEIKLPSREDWERKAKLFAEEHRQLLTPASRYILVECQTRLENGLRFWSEFVLDEDVVL